MTKKQLSAKWYLITIVLTLLFMTSSGVLTASASDTEKYDMLSFKKISVEKGLEHLSKANIGDVSSLPGSPTVLVTSSNPANLAKARVIRDLVDCSQEYAVEFVPFIAKQLPSGSQIMNEIGTMAIGTFANPPAKDGNSRTIVDACEDKIIIIAPLRMIDRIVKATEKLQKTDSPNIGKLVATNETKHSPVTQNNKPNIAPSLLAENVSDNNENENLNLRITDPEPIREVSSEPVQTRSNLLAENSVVDLSSIPNPDQEIVLDLADQLTLTEFISWVGPYLQMDFMYNASDLANKEITLNMNGVLKGSVKIRDLYNYLDQVLIFTGLAMTRNGNNNLVTIVPKGSAINVDPRIIPRDILPGDQVIIDTFKLENISTTTAEELINKMQLGIQITAIAESKTLMVAEYASRMPRIRELLRIIDIPGNPKKFRYRQLQYTEPETLVPKIQSLAEQLETVSVTISTNATTQATPERPTQRANESASAYQSRLRAWENQVRALANETAARGATSSTIGGEVTASTVFIDSDERTNRVLMIGLDKQLDQVAELIDTLDIAQSDPREYREYKIEYLDAEEVLSKLQDLGVIPKTEETKETTRTTGRTGQSSSRITSGTEPRELLNVESMPVSSAQGEDGTLLAVGKEPIAVLVASTNSIIINATRAQHEHIGSIIELLDKQIDAIPFKIYKLKNADPEHLLSILQPLIEDTIRGPEDKIESVVPKQDGQITIVSDPNTSSLIVNANQKNQNWIESLIKVLDKRRPQVLIDVTLVQISKNDAFNYDLNLISSIPDLTSTSGLTSAILPGVSTGASNLVEPLMNSNRAHFLDFQSNSGEGTGFYGDKHINTLLTLMEQKDYGRVMAKPKILVNDNQRGTIVSKDRTYVVIKSSTPYSTANAGQQENFFETTTKFEGYDAGIELGITPHISESDLLRLDILLTRSDFGTITGDKPPDTTESTVETKVTVPDGSTIILGGMLKMNQSKGGTKVPILSSIPLVGSLFRSVNNSDIQRNLYVFVKAEIIRPPDDDNEGQLDLERISKLNQESFEEHEKEFQEYQSFPGFKPTPMEPVNVLDAR